MMRREVRLVAMASALGVAAAAGCGRTGIEVDSGPPESTFAVSDYFSPTGLIADGTSPGLLGMQVNEGCKPRPPNARGNCYVFTYHTNPGENGPFAGMFWLFPDANWGSNPGRAVDTTRFQQIRFSAAVEGPTPFTTSNGVDGVFVTRAGEINSFNNPQGHADAFALDGSATIGPDIGSDLKAFHLPITDSDRTLNCVDPKVVCANGAASALISAFSWALAYPDGSDPSGATPVKIYLDDIVWDTEPAPL
jgi:hypothetical protein